MTVGVVGRRNRFEPRGWLPLLIGVPVLAIGLTLWRNLDRPLQFLTGAVGFALVLGGAGEITDLDVWHGGLVLLAIGVRVRRRRRAGPNRTEADRARDRCVQCLHRLVHAR